MFIGYKKIGDCFIRSNANIDAKTNESQTPLHYAVKFGSETLQIDVIESL